MASTPDLDESAGRAARVNAIRERVVDLRIVPCSISGAKALVRDWHAHHRPPVSGLFAVAVADADGIVGVAIAGRPIARMSDDGLTIEVTRVAVRREGDGPGVMNACSMLYGAIRRAASALGYGRVVTYTIEGEPGSFLKGAGFRCTARTKGSAGWASHPRTSYTSPILALASGVEAEMSFPADVKLRWDWP